MKKVLILVLIFLAGAGSILSQSITVTSPTAGQKFKFGDTITIDWTSIGISGDIKITLWTGNGSSGKTIVYPCAYNASPVFYTINPPTVQAGDYFIRIKHDTSSVTNASGVFSVEPDVDLLEGTFAIADISYGAVGKKIYAVNVLVEYEAKKDFVLCKTITGKCNADLGSMVLTYAIKNWKWQNDQPVEDELSGCNYACLKSCGTIHYPTAVQRAGKGTFQVTVYPKTNNELNGIIKQTCIGGGWSAYDLTCKSYYYPSLTVTLTLCVSFLDPPNAYQYKMVSETSSRCCIWLDKADMQVAGDMSCGW